jgi:hypothetical protein
VPGRPRRHANPAAKQAAYRHQQQWRRLVALQEEYAQLHVGAHGTTAHLQPHATDEQRALQAAAKERALAEVLWTLQTLIADFGYAEVDTHVLQHLRPAPGDRTTP